MNAQDQPKPGVVKRYAMQPRRVRWPLLVGIAAGHGLALYGLAHAFAPGVMRSVEREVIAVFDAPAPEPPPPPPPDNRPQPDQGAAGEAGEEALAAPVSAPEIVLAVPEPEPLPPTASTGVQSESGARQSGEGTGAAGKGPGTGSGNEGRGRGGVAVTRPQHVSGAIDNARDYPIPPGGRSARRDTEVIVRVIVGVNGRARDCTIYRASPDPEADAITCRLVVERLGFRPATDANGNPVPAPFYWRQRWF